MFPVNNKLDRTKLRGMEFSSHTMDTWFFNALFLAGDGMEWHTKGDRRQSSSESNFLVQKLRKEIMGNCQKRTKHCSLSPASIIHLRSVLLLSVYFLPSVIPLVAAATDTLLQGQSIKDDGRPLVSARGDFALGFFSPPNTTNRYVGIWYHNIPGEDVVWVANRERPIPDRSGTFTLHDSGALVVSDQSNSTLWSSSNATGPAVGSVSAQLSDLGNFIVSNGSFGSPMWQMFDHPADTFLPGMQVGLDMTTGVVSGWTSWSSAQDPSPGRFFSSVDPRGIPQSLIWERSSNGTLRRLWRSGQWNGATYSGIYDTKPFYLYGIRYSNPVVEKKLYYSYTPFNNDTYVRMVVLPGGTRVQYNWTRGVSERWEKFWEQPITPCEMYNACGSNAVCSEDMQEKPAATCECWKGFQPLAPADWSRGEWNKGCVRRTALVCNSSSVEGRDYGFAKFEAMKIPDSSMWIGNLEVDDCRNICGRNCSCNAYAFVNGIGCMVWSGDLDDVRIMPSGGNEIYIKLVQSELLDVAERKKKSSKTYVIGIVLGSLLVAAGLLAVFYKCRSRKREIKNKGQKMGFTLMSTDKEQKQGDMTDLPVFSFDEIAMATDKFSEFKLLGKGGFGPVYKGMISGRQEVAVKRLSKDSGQGVEQFKNEVLLIAQLQHRNLVRLLGCCIQDDEKMLVYEYMHNKSLDVFLFEPKNQAMLNWKMRLDIIHGIARGLIYLHHDSRLRIVHRDLKASNILLDEGMQPKISDFGMARIFGGNQNQANTNRVVGTYGYMAPEYAMDGLFSIKSDVYSFGVLVLEIVSGKKSQFDISYGLFTNLLSQAWHMWEAGQALELADPAITSSLSPEEALKCINIALLCVQDRAADRPTMSTVLLMLGSEYINCPSPKQPTFTTERSNDASDSPTGPNSHGLSSTDTTITIIVRR